jgi:hypothetical protein
MERRTLARRLSTSGTLREAATLSKVRKAQAEQAPRVKAVKGEIGSSLVPDHPDNITGHVLLMEALGTVDFDFFNALLGQLANASSASREVDEQGINFMLSVVKGIEPRDQVEAMLGAQMAAVHTATMTYARRLAQVENIPQQDSAERFPNQVPAYTDAPLSAVRTPGSSWATMKRPWFGYGGKSAAKSSRRTCRTT